MSPILFHRLRHHTRALLAALVIGHCSLLIPSQLRAAEMTLDSVTIADLNAAFSKGTLTAEKLTELYLARIAAYDKQGPTLNTVITLNPKALAEAKALDAERKAGKVRGPLHGVPIILKDNFDTFDLVTTGGSQMLEGSIPPNDAFVVKKLREAGCIILAKVNTSEFAGGGGSVGGATDPEVLKSGTVPNGFSSAGGQTRNPHDTARGPSGSSGGTGSGIAATFAQFGLGTDTGGSVRGPASFQGLAGLKPTRGLMSRDGIIPLALTFDTGGPIARSVYDVAASLSAMVGVDKADDATKGSIGHFEKDYTKFLKLGSLKGARIGVARDFFGKDAEVDRVMEESIATLKKLGAVIIDDVKYPEYIHQTKMPMMMLIVNAEFKAQITQYLSTLKSGFPKTFDDLVRLANDPATKYRSPEKAYALKYSAARALELDDPVYLAAKNQGLALTTSVINGLFEKHKLDAIIYPTSPRGATLIKPLTPPMPAGGADSATAFANITGYPDLIVPAGLTKDGLPVTISFFGPAWSEPKLLGYGFDFEQATKARVLPKTTPALPGETIAF